MAMDGIKISLGALSQSAGNIRTLNLNLTKILGEMQTEMKGLNSTWTSDSANTITNKFNSLAPKFDDYRKVIDAYAKFLDLTVTNYDATETAINSNASSFK